jgi:polyhydroxyalkanoate synthesis regulator phasin
MSVKYVKNSSGRGLLLGDTKALAVLSEKEAVQQTLRALQTQIDNLQERIARLENGKKD